MLKATKNIFKSKKEFVNEQRICINVKWSIRLYKLAKKRKLVIDYEVSAQQEHSHTALLSIEAAYDRTNRKRGVKARRQHIVRAGAERDVQYQPNDGQASAPGIG
ncbi:hypothetical protein PAT3040_04860 [Paenibacillus agaridevorans]|uniref:Uncharacterized protein n=1 Tax=Paenibacillus agaridevorans TaxID=171404 RepID=A0A2R5ETX8_9BACL|nr:hypothetical protein PAT3040_04860 [Paenibacillus agaridevorans]